MLFNWDASGIQKSFSEHVFEAFASGICVLAVQNMVPELARIGSILSVCVSGQNSFVISEKKITQKRELEPISVGKRNISVPPCRGRCTLLK